MKIGYARVSTEEQSLALQRAALEAAGCGVIFEDPGVSGAARDRPGLNAAINRLAPGDMLVVWRLDRLGRSLSDLILLLDRLGQRGIGFRSLSEAIETESPGGRLLFHLMASLAEFERGLIAERTRAGLAAAKAGGRRLGRPPALNAAQIAEAQKLRAAGRPITEIARLFRVDRSTVYRALRD